MNIQGRIQGRGYHYLFSINRSIKSLIEHMHCTLPLARLTYDAFKKKKKKKTHQRHVIITVRAI